MRDLQTWHTCVGCCCHDVHNALKWSVMEYVSDKNIMRSAWIVLESLRSGFSLLVSEMGSWVARHLSYGDHLDADALRQYWVMLDVGSEYVELLVDLQLRWQDGKLWVAGTWQGNDKLPELITQCFMHVWSFKVFSDSRWCGLTACCRSLVASLTLGLRSLVNDIIASGRYSTYYIGGFGNLNDDVIRLCLRVAASGHVSDTILCMVLEDDRLPKLMDDILEEIDAEVNYVTSLSDGVLSILGSVAGLAVRPLRDELIHAAAVQAGYLKMRFREAQQAPWHLACGDVIANLLRFAQGDEPVEPTANKIYKLLKMGFPVEHLALGVNLLGQVGWSGKVVEQGHVAAAMIMRHHKNYSSSTMQARSCLLQALPLFAIDVGEKRIERLQTRLERLSRKQPQRITGRHMLMKRSAEQVTAWQEQGHSFNSDIGHVVMRGHFRLWSGMARRPNWKPVLPTFVKNGDASSRNRRMIFVQSCALGRIGCDIEELAMMDACRFHLACSRRDRGRNSMSLHDLHSGQQVVSSS